MKRWALALALACGCGGGDGDAADAGDPDAEVCRVADGTGVSFDPDDVVCRKLSSYRLFTDDAARVPNQGVVPYAINTPLFSDYAYKDRFVWLPPGTRMTYDAEAAFALPTGAIIVKTFWYPADARDPDGPRQLLETRLLIHRAGGWDGETYVWNAEQAEATRKVAGETIAARWIDEDGATRDHDYLVPNKNQCKQCHEELDDTVLPIGPKARHVNRDFDYGDGAVNQLTHLAAIGLLDGAPADPATEAPRAPDAFDDATGSVEARARAWLDINCAHCHNPRGAARTSGLDLRASQETAYEYGVCKTPVAAGGGAGDRQYNIVPGAPDESILVYRLESLEPDVMMPELGRRLVHAEGVALVRQWVTELGGGPCGTP